MRYILVSFLMLGLPFWGTGQRVNSLLQQVNEAETDSIRINVYRELSVHYLYSNLDSALHYANAGLSYARQKKSVIGAAIMIHALAEANERHGLLEAARAQYLEARSLFMEAGSAKGIARTTNGLGVVAGKTGRYEEATRHFLEALRIYEETADAHGMVQTYIKLGVVNDHLGNLEQALSYYLKAEALNTSSSTATLTLLNNIGIIYGKRNDLQRALTYFRRGLKAGKSAASTGIYVSLLGSIGTAQEKAGNLDSALYFQERALASAREHSLPEEEARALVNLASLYGKVDRRKSLVLLNEALAITERIRHVILMTEIYASMITLYTEQNRYKEAFLLSEKKRLLQDSLFSLQKSKEIANLQAVHEVARQETEIKDLAMLNEKSIIQRDIMIGIAVAAVMVIAIAWYFNRKISNLNTQLLRKQIELKNSNTVKDKLFSILGHDLRAPLNRVIGFLNVLAIRERDQEERELIEKLRQQSMNTLETLNNLLMWGQSQLKGKRLNQQTIEIKEQLKKTIFFATDYATQKCVRIVDNTPAGLTVFADPSHFDFAVRNLLSNAIKFSHSGGAVMVNATQSGQRVVFSISDSGVGIPPERQNQIFSAGAESVRGTWDEKGTGIGLMLCREYIAENGGRLWLESEPGKGSTFYFSLMQGPSPAADGAASSRSETTGEVIPSLS